MSLILEKFKEIQKDLSTVKEPESLIIAYNRVFALVNKQYGTVNAYSNNLKEIRKYANFEAFLRTNINSLKGVLHLIIDDLELKNSTILNNSVHLKAKKIVDDIMKQNITIKKKVFIVHGHNEIMQQSVARFIEKLGLEAIILSEQVNNGKTIIEKFELHADVDFAIILLSADDKGYSVKEGSRKAKFRARQNVIFELGYFTAKFKREKIVALVENLSNFETPSDIHGVVYTSFDNPDGSWKSYVLRELKSSGFDIDSNKIY